jgi:hypothetical protein
MKKETKHGIKCLVIKFIPIYIRKFGKKVSNLELLQWLVGSKKRLGKFIVEWKRIRQEID